MSCHLVVRVEVAERARRGAERGRMWLHDSPRPAGDPEEGGGGEKKKREEEEREEREEGEGRGGEGEEGRRREEEALD